MKKTVAVIFLLSLVIMLAGAQQAKYDCLIFEFDLTQTTIIEINRKINFYLNDGYMVVSTAIWENTYIVILQERIG